jgi:hypothetical protein
MVTIDGFNRPEPLIKLSYDAETAAIASLLQELSGRQDDVNSQNAVIRHYNDVFAVHIGRYEANKDREREVQTDDKD